MLTRLKFERQSQGLRQVDVARAAGMSVFELRLAELGRLVPTEEQLGALGQTLHVHPADRLLLRAVVVEPLPAEVEA